MRNQTVVERLKWITHNTTEEILSLAFLSTIRIIAVGKVVHKKRRGTFSFTGSPRTEGHHGIAARKFGWGKTG